MAQQTVIPAVPSVIEVGGDTVTLISLHLAHVSSKSQPGMLHSVTDYRCSCRGFNYRNHCRHLEAVRIAREQLAADCGPESDEPTNVVDFPADITQPNANGLVWAGFRRGWVEPSAL